MASSSGLTAQQAQMLQEFHDNVGRVQNDLQQQFRQVAQTIDPQSAQQIPSRYDETQIRQREAAVKGQSGTVQQLESQFYQAQQALQNFQNTSQQVIGQSR